MTCVPITILLFLVPRKSFVAVCLRVVLFLLEAQSFWGIAGLSGRNLLIIQLVLKVSERPHIGYANIPKKMLEYKRTKP